MPCLMASVSSLQPARSYRSVGPFSWLSVTDHLDPKYGGICAVVPELCDAVNRAGECRMSVGGFCPPQECVPELPGISTTRYPSGWRQWTSRSLLAKFAAHIRNSDGVHIHGIWREHCSLTAWYAREADRPYIISAHGMLDDWAVNNKRWKKALYAALVERRNCEGARCVHALTRAEAINYRSFGIRRPIAIVPNGITVPTSLSSRQFLEAHPHLKDRRIVLFLGRIHPKKGVDLVCRAWPSINRSHPDAHLVIAGPDFENSQSRIEAIVEDTGMRRHVTFTGMLRGSMKWSALASCDIFILPSHSEGLSVSVLEAMGAARPVVVTRQCNIPEVRNYSCGIEIEPRPKEIVDSVSALLSLNTSQLSALGRNGQLLVRNRFSWPTIGGQMTSLYRWAMGGPVPADVEFVEN